MGENANKNIALRAKLIVFMGYQLAKVSIYIVAMSLPVHAPAHPLALLLVTAHAK